MTVAGDSISEGVVQSLRMWNIRMGNTPSQDLMWFDALGRFNRMEQTKLDGLEVVVGTEAGEHIFSIARPEVIEWHTFCSKKTGQCDTYVSPDHSPHYTLYRKYLPKGSKYLLSQYRNWMMAHMTADNTHVDDNRQEYRATFDSGSQLYIRPYRNGREFYFCRKGQREGNCFIEIHDGLYGDVASDVFALPLIERMKNVKRSALDQPAETPTSAR